MELLATGQSSELAEGQTKAPSNQRVRPLVDILQSHREQAVGGVPPLAAVEFTFGLPMPRVVVNVRKVGQAGEELVQACAVEGMKLTLEAWHAV